jgi:hypothetical protein
VEYTATDTLTAWHLDRLVPPPEHVLRVSFDEREHAKRRGARWNKELKSWVLCTREPLGREAAAAMAAARAILRRGKAGISCRRPVRRGHRYPT